MAKKKKSLQATIEAVRASRKRLLTNESPFAFKEAYVKLRTNLMLCMTADKKRACTSFAVTSAKPSEGKSLTAANIAISYAMLGKKVLLIDADMRKPMQRRLWRVEKSTGLCDFLARISKLELEKVKGLPLWIACTGTIPPNPSEQLSSERMKRFVEESAKVYDYIIIDCPPSLGLLNTNALTAADSVMIPVQCEYFALEGLTQLLSTIRLIQKLWNPRLSIEGVLLTMFDVRTKLSVEVQQEVRKYFKEKVYRGYIPRNVRLSEAPSREESIFEYDTKSEGAKAYAAIVKEVLMQNERGGR